MAYTPELSWKASCMLRRISWALGVPMTKGIEHVFDYLPKILDSTMICKACRDKSKCSNCDFNPHNQFQDERR